MSLEDELLNIIADLLSLGNNNAFISRLFSREAGNWMNLVALCESLTIYRERIKTITEAEPGIINVTWLEYPDSAYGKGFCVIVFFFEPLNWSNVAIYNKARFKS